MFYPMKLYIENIAACIIDIHGVVAEERGETYASAISFIKKGRAAGLRFAVISARRNGRAMLENAGVSDLFQVVIDADCVAEMGLAAKPAPDIFLEAADRLDVKAARVVVIADGPNGVQGAKAGGFARVIGLDRHHQGPELENFGADPVVRDLAELRLESGAEPGKKEKKLQSALEKTPRIFQRLQQELPAIFLDYDGTLTPIVDDPAEARLDEKNREVLQRLAKHMFVAVISGRSLADVKQMVNIEELAYAGSHGFEMSAGIGYASNESPMP